MIKLTTPERELLIDLLSRKACKLNNVARQLHDNVPQAHYDLVADRHAGRVDARLKMIYGMLNKLETDRQE